MPIDPVTGAALLGSGANLAGQAINYFATKDLNRETREYNTEMYNKQYIDNIKLWKLQNEYNSPENQRARLVNAGLNPALMYGGSGGGGVPASPISPSKFNQWNPQTPQVNPDSFLNSIYSLPIAGAETKTKRAQAEMEEMQKIVKEYVFGDLTWHRGLEAQWNKAIHDAQIRDYDVQQTHYILENREEILDAKLGESISRSKLNNARRWYMETDALLYEKTGLLLSDDFFYRNLMKDMNVSEQDQFIMNLISTLKMIASPFKIGK